MSPTGPENPVGEAVSRCKPCTRKRWTNRPSMGGAMRRSAFPCREGRRALVLEVENRWGYGFLGQRTLRKTQNLAQGRGLFLRETKPFF